MQHMGFSIWGTVVLALVLAPNVVWVLAPPVDTPPPTAHPRRLVVLERAGQVGCVAAMPFVGSHLTPGSAPVWSGGVVLCVAVYTGLWLRFARRGRRHRWLFEPWGPVVVPMAVMPAATFAMVAAAGRSVPLGVAAAVFAAGHLPVSLLTWRAVRLSAPTAPVP